MKKLSTRLSVLIFNAAITLLCIISILAYFIAPFWKIDVSYHLSAEQLQELLSSSIQETEGETEAPIDIEKMLKEVVGEEGVTIPVAIQFQSKDVLSAISEDATVVVSNIILDNVDVIIQKLSKPINTIAKNLVRTVSNAILETSVSELVTSLAGEGSQLADVLASANLPETYITDKAHEITNKIFAEGATVQEVSSSTVAIVEETIDALKTSDPEKYQDLNLSEEDKEQITSGLEEVLTMVSDENGNIDPDMLLENLLEMLTKAEEDFAPDTPDPATEATSTIIKASAEGENPIDDLEKKLREELSNAIPQETIEDIATGLKFAGFFLLLSLLPWLYLIVKILVKLPMANNAIKLKAPIWLGWAPFGILYLIPTIVWNFVLPAFMPSPEEAATVSLLSNVSVHFSTAGWVAFASAIALIVISFFYSPLRKQLKLIQKGEIKLADSTSTAAPAAAQATESEVAATETEAMEASNKNAEEQTK